MPSFDVVSEVDMHEVANAVDQAAREVANRFDFKGVDARFERDAHEVALVAEAEFQLGQMLDILRAKLAKRGIDTGCLEVGHVEQAGRQARQRVVLRHGIDGDLARAMVKRVKGAKLKVQAQVQGDQLRVTGKKRDDLQQVIALLRGADDIDLPLQFTNFRD
ncbi:MAG: YajQ family cyclic di-GMP-binding protein [Gammaproteobacteria bacterium]|nr:YajQ family cyclic di-GMP-binding protein [Gammaproteobacteria bacterium]